MWAGIFSIPPLLGWYATHLQIVTDHLPSGSQNWLSNALLGLFVIFAVIALVAHAVLQARLEKQLELGNPKQGSAVPAAGLMLYRDWAEQWFRESCKNKSHSGSVTLDLTKHDGCTFSNCYMSWSGLACALDGCSFYGTNNVTVKADDFARAVSFFIRHARVPGDATLR